MPEFPLDQWFDLSKRISKDDAETAQAQMLLYAFKDGIDLEDKEVQSDIQELHRAVKAHNMDLAAK